MKPAGAKIVSVKAEVRQTSRYVRCASDSGLPNHSNADNSRWRVDQMPHRRADTVIGKPPAGWTVSFCTGQGLQSAVQVKRKRWSNSASAITASCSAKLAPMQMRGPAPNGRYWNLSIVPLFSGQKRDGINASGWAHSLRCRWSVHGITNTVTPALISMSP